MRGDFWGGKVVEWRGYDAGILGGFGGGNGGDLLGGTGTGSDGMEEEKELSFLQRERGRRMGALSSGLLSLSGRPKVLEGGMEGRLYQELRIETSVQWI